MTDRQIQLDERINARIATGTTVAIGDLPRGTIFWWPIEDRRVEAYIPDGLHSEQTMAIVTEDGNRVVVSRTEHVEVIMFPDELAALFLNVTQMQIASHPPSHLM